MDLQKLRRETAADHDRTEAAVPLLRERLSRADYARVLARLYGFVRGWERWAAARVPADLRPLLAERQRSRLIVQDLEFLGQPLPGHVAALDSISEAQPVSRASFLGAMYVMEGSTLGGQYLAVEVERTLGLRHGEGNAYFVGYGARTGSMWNGFRAVLAALPEADADEVIASAKRMFAAFAQWMLAADGGGAEPQIDRTESGTDLHA